MTRKIQPVSFNLEDIYERKLHEYALEQNKYFSKYVKWLIDKDRSCASMVAAVSVTKTVVEEKPVKFGKSVAKGFL